MMSLTAMRVDLGSPSRSTVTEHTQGTKTPFEAPHGDPPMMRWKHRCSREPPRVQDFDRPTFPSWSLRKEELIQAVEPESMLPLAARIRMRIHGMQKAWISFRGLGNEVEIHRRFVLGWARQTAPD